MKKKKTTILFLSLGILASMTITTYAATVPHNGSYKAKYAKVEGKDDYYKRQAMDGKFSGNRNGCTMMYIKDNNGNITASGSVHYNKQNDHVFTKYAVAENHSHSCTDNLIY